MKYTSTMKQLTFLVLTTVLLASCTALQPTQAPQPTVDTEATMNVVRTEAAATVEAELASRPTATPLPTATQPPATPTVAEPTATLAPLPTATLPPAPTAIPTKTTAPGGGGGVVVPTWTATATSYQCSVTAAAPASGAVFAPNADFDGRWTLKNTGTQAWMDYDVDYRWAETGAKLHTGAAAFDLPSSIQPGDSVELIVDMEAPDTVGSYTTTWVLAKGSQVLCTMVVKIEVKTP